MAKTKQNTKILSICKDMEQLELLYLKIMQTGANTSESNWAVSHKVKY